jgi:AcrR family transcriptional regulator
MTTDQDKPLRADAQRNRAALVAKAREVFDSGAFFDLRYDDFAALAGVGTGTLYRHFPTRQALAEAVYREEIAALGARARELQAALPADEALSVFLRGMVAHMQAHQGLARTLATLLTASSANSASLAEGGHMLEQAVSDLVAAAVQDGTVRDDVSAASVMMALHGIGAAHDRYGWQAEAEGLITLVLDGLRRPREQRRTTLEATSDRHGDAPPKSAMSSLAAAEREGQAGPGTGTGPA